MNNDAQVSAIVGEFNRFVEKLVTRLNLDIVAFLKRDTPILTGWARANWIPSIGKDVTTTAGTRPQAELGQLDYSPQESGTAELSKYKLSMGSIFISNNVDYILKLNDGSSRQAPRAFVQADIERAIVAAGGHQ